MPNTTADYLIQAQSDRDDLADNLVAQGVAASHSETITELVPKVLDIQTGGSADGSLSNPFVLRANYNVSMEVTV